MLRILNLERNYVINLVILIIAKEIKAPVFLRSVRLKANEATMKVCD